MVCVSYFVTFQLVMMPDDAFYFLFVICDPLVNRNFVLLSVYCMQWVLHTVES